MSAGISCTNELYELLDRIDWLITTLLKISKLDAGTVQIQQRNGQPGNADK